MAQNPWFNSRNPAGALVSNRLGFTGDLLVGQQHAALYESAYAAQQFLGTNQAGATLSAALAATYTGLVLSNPAANTKNLIVERVSGLLEVAPAALTALGLITGFAAGGITVHTTALTPINAKLNGAAPTGKLDAAATLVGTPAWAQWLAVTPSATGVVSFMTDLQGGLIIPPGGYVAIGASIAGPAAGFLGSFQWEEAPV